MLTGGVVMKPIETSSEESFVPEPLTGGVVMKPIETSVSSGFIPNFCC